MSEPIDPARQSGRTTRQMMGARPFSIFVWVNGNLHYPARLAASIGRPDLGFASPSEVRNRMMGTTRRIVVDHAAELPIEVLDLIRAHNDKCDRIERGRA
ncbi:MAG: hypothetical protein ACK5XA_08410 [Tagaea sp.]